ncbi:unnamed protein product, partial [Rotaria magnacalcarata]
NELEFERAGIIVSVPNNEVARLMYYLHCICIVIDCNNDANIQCYINYNNWYQLSIDEQKVLIDLCYAFSPDMCHNKVFFQFDGLCPYASNEFYEIQQIRHQFLVAGSILIAGQQRCINRIMAFKI